MFKIHVKQLYNKDCQTIFKAISDHESFLSGAGIQCELIKEGIKDRNGNGAIRRIIADKLIFEERILDYKPNQHFSYVIISLTPKQPIIHHKGWLDFSEVDGKTQVDWHSHFEITTPLVGKLIGWVVKRQMSKAFAKRLAYIKN